MIEALPGLGSVLYLHAASRMTMPTVLPQGLLVMERDFTPLLEARWLAAISVVTNDGPREWCECVDSFGRTLARWHLLPDTDYLAWETMTAACLGDVSLPMGTQPLRADCASVLGFRLRKFAGLQLMEREASPALSQLSDRIATGIARAESTVRRV